ncbi:AAA-ATPase At3g50940-like [Sesamum indicum]|uniref:AAA-ATPase At3g50940-like n=1 Tax=Sesamum indicum TaxID=4182 RepID=A0A6I9TDZ9_SESIN|nr:AAA-ATPase At3g50940-like [Sesamum indicum]
MAVSFSSIPPASTIFGAYASVSAFIMLIQTMLNQLVPRQVQQYVLNMIHHYFRPRTNNATIVVEERDGMSGNEVYTAAETYLCTKIRPDIERLKISKRHKDVGVNIKFAQCEKIADFYDGVEMEWRFVHEERKKTSKVIDEDTDNVLIESEKRYFELCFDKKDKEKVLDSYIPFVLERAKVIKAENKIVKLHTLACAASYSSSIVWDSINLEHPSTFDTLAMDPGIKKSIIEDLNRFVRRKEFYRKVGRAWKRGYLLYGPPGTGKSSLIAAIANYLKFDIYDLELTNVKRDSDLRKLLLRTGNRSILVIEDIDCTVELPDRKGPSASHDGHGHGQCHRPRDHQFTLSGLLNFIDGLWSSCGDERIIIFTTNNKDKLDPALLRPGRMDMHIHMSYLTPDGFKLLASTYLNFHDSHHPCFLEIEDMINNMQVTPAEVAEELMKSDDADVALGGLVNFLKCKKKIDPNAVTEKQIDDGDGEDDGKEKEVMADDSDIELVTH